MFELNSSFFITIYVPFQIHTCEFNMEPLMANADAIFCVQLQFLFVKASAFLMLLVSVLLQLTLPLTEWSSNNSDYVIIVSMGLFGYQPVILLRN